MSLNKKDDWSEVIEGFDYEGLYALKTYLGSRFKLGENVSFDQILSHLEGLDGDDAEGKKWVLEHIRKLRDSMMKVLN